MRRKATAPQRMGVGPTGNATLQQKDDRLTIASVSERSAWGWGPTGNAALQQKDDRLTIASVSERSAWGWGPTRSE